MGILESNIHFQNLDGIIDNHSDCQIRYVVNGPLSQSQVSQGTTLQIQDQIQQQKDLTKQLYKFQYGGSVPPYCTKYYEFKNIENQYKFSVFAVRRKGNGEEEEIALQKDLKITSQKIVCLRITSKLQVQHLHKDEIKQLEERKAVEKQFINHSSIINNSSLSHQLVTLLPLTINKAKLLFKATQHNFNTQIFYQNHGLAPHVLLICKTNQDKVIGVYSYNSLISPQNGHYDQHGWRRITDSTGTSFIFSLSSNDIFKLNVIQNSIFYNNNQEQICFGNDQFRINNHSDLKKCLTTNINTNYINHNYNNDIQSYKLLNGNQSPQFTTKQWEVWQLSTSQMDGQDTYIIDI